MDSGTGGRGRGTDTKKYKRECSVIPFKVTKAHSVVRHLFVQQYRSKERHPQRPTAKTMFVRNVPPYCTKDALKTMFTVCGEVINVELLAKPGDPEETANDDPDGFFAVSKPICYQVAYVVFKTDAAMYKALKLKTEEPLVLFDSIDDAPVGMNKWIADYKRTNLVDANHLQDYVDKWMTEYDTKQNEEQGVAIGKATVADDEGWVTVSRADRRSTPAHKPTNIRAMKKLKRQTEKQELLNFYRFQLRAQKKANVTELKERFELDKHKIAEMKANRKFKPF